MAKPARPKQAADERAMDGAAQGDDVRYDRTLRPQTFDDYVGQSKHKDNLRVFVQAARQRKEPLDHLLLCGPPGLGKTTLAQILAHEMGVQLHMTNGPVVEHKGALAGLLTKLQPGDILFIDEIHRLNPVVEESLYPAMEDFRIDVMTGEGAFASAIQINVHPFTLVGATTRTGLLTAPLFSRFGHVVRLDFYPNDELAQIVLRSAKLLQVSCDKDAALEIARRARGTPPAAHREPPLAPRARFRPGPRLGRDRHEDRGDGQRAPRDRRRGLRRDGPSPLACDHRGLRRRPGRRGNARGRAG